MTTAEAAAAWRVSIRRVRAMLKAEQIPGAFRDVTTPQAEWVIPDGTPKPKPGRPGPKPSK